MNGGADPGMSGGMDMIRRGNGTAKRDDHVVIEGEQVTPFVVEMQRFNRRGIIMASHMPPPRISDLPREERLDALYRRFADDRARYMEMRTRRPGLLHRLLHMI
ncbi:hypothetical protein [Sphingomonas sp. SORGH_AS_0879]|uniref:hypothetical protein n=1 Tax=Sphingomonas sp. SORGH_AS_0879 TaxID=3041790 RepID=UPI00277FCAE0|nr:hypothetical protein [Sphingomonas sp. SORGH_AS_0879]MDQ1229460.1 hypothetical protein [Sphingomonas sp. SORGH_AS_0879]